ncbi:jg14197 [Pararge aegeria aegeria]|uniref:Jg14197 protein n=1 Tax=Pararge aegeria aegeria TaxID=348720 RepID=A0A8S4QI01_9NEOP|nr:jg14197 [Pararge aegeria aegeria]
MGVLKPFNWLDLPSLNEMNFYRKVTFLKSTEVRTRIHFYDCTYRCAIGMFIELPEGAHSKFTFEIVLEENVLSAPQKPP